jgi:hypothetical protein
LKIYLKIPKITLQEPFFKDEQSYEAEEPCRKRVKEEVDENNDKGKEKTVVRRQPVATSKRSERTIDIVAAYPMKQTPGHTGYLTFAVLYP